MTDLDDELVRLARGGDSSAFGALYQRHVRLALHYARHWCAAGEAEDLVHDTFLRVVDPATPYRADGRFRSWFLVLLRHSATDRTRRLRRRLRLLVGRSRPEREGTACDPIEPRDDVMRLLGQLPAPQRRALELRVLWGLSYEEIAAVEGADPSTLRSRVFYGLQRVRSGLMASDCSAGARAEHHAGNGGGRAACRDDNGTIADTHVRRGEPASPSTAARRRPAVKELRHP